MKENQLSDDFTQGNIAGKLLKFMIPILGALILQAMYGAVDLLVVGQFGTDAGISAVSTGSNIINLVTFVIAGLTMGVTVLISRYLGEQAMEKIGKVIGGAIAFFFLLTAVLMALLLLFAPNFAGWLNAPQEAYDLTVTYVRICGAGLAFVVAYNVISGIFRGLGNSRLPLIFVAIACGVNILGDLLFVAVLGMNVAGAALATILAQFVSVVMSLVIIRRQQLPFSVSGKDIGFHPEIKTFLRLGFPIALQDMLVNISFLILCAIVNGIGLEASSGYGIAQKVTAFVMLIPSSLMQSMSAFVAQNVGAGKEERAKKAMLAGMAIGACIGVFIFAFSFFRGDLPSALFTSDSGYIAKSAEYLKGFSPEAILTCLVFSYIGYFNGHGKTMPVMVQGITSSFLVRVPLSYLFSIQPGANLVTIGLAVPITSVYGILFFTVCYVKFQRELSG
ncbi:MATE family efflux transporter [Petralouisia muris]|uniref:MATE family efflux transporter n=1 Tax=Petralouisia muris TaxID=3032872 RepID=A0AC61RUH5_9FIRM|nr:MATE family efflux transporter [Petralouisia muris]TGY95503.1 MATE family efflux transporter [Petralouisia muris]